MAILWYFPSYFPTVSRLSLKSMYCSYRGFPGGSVVKNLHVGDAGLVLGSGRPPGGGNGKPLQYSCLEPMHRGAWQATVLGVTESDTTEQLTHKHNIYNVKKTCVH